MGTLVAGCGCEDPNNPNWYHLTRCPVAKSLRGSWCTPQWIADIVGRRDLDPCSNERSLIRAKTHVFLGHSGNGLVHTEGVRGLFRTHAQFATRLADWSCETFINPPYDGVLDWVQHYRHTRFIYLLRWDPSTRWFRELYPDCTHVWHPPRRIGFIPPPRIRASSNPFPHALYLNRPNDGVLRRLNAAGGYLTRTQ